MADPKPKTDIDADNETLVSPNGDTTADRYRKAKERDAKLTNEERIEQLREGAKRFNEMFPDFYDEEDKDNAKD